jgi:hypothetical protein
VWDSALVSTQGPGQERPPRLPVRRPEGDGFAAALSVAIATEGLTLRDLRRRLPASCVAYQRTAEGLSAATVDLHDTTSAHLTARSFGPGAAGIRWEG